jgi:anti-anti-sigma regulatory factor
MRIQEIDLQKVAFLKLRGRLNKSAVREIVKRTRTLLEENRFKIILDMEKVVMENQGLLLLAAFIHSFRQNDGSVKLISAGKRGFEKIELWKLPITIPMSAVQTLYH